MARPHLLRILGVTFGIAMTIGSVIGVGILRSPGSVAALLQSPALILFVWVLGGVYVLIAVNSFAELSTMLPDAGGPYVYAKRTHGDYGGFFVGWSDWFVNMNAAAFLSVAFGEYCAVLIPALGSFQTEIGITELFTVAFAHLRGLRTGSWIQQVTSVANVLIFAAIIVACFVFSGTGGAETAQRAPRLQPQTPVAMLIGIVLALQLILETYAGWASPVYFAEENTDPGRNLPRALLFGVGVVIAVYVLFNLAMVRVLPVETLAGSKLAAADAVQAIFGGRAGQLLTVVALVSLLSIINAQVLFTPRILFALSRGGLFSGKGVSVNSGGTPAVALIVTVAAAAGLAVIGSFETLFALNAFVGVIVQVLIFSSLFILRAREPNLPRPYRAKGYPLVPLLSVVIAVALFVGYVVTNTRNSMYGLLLVALSYPAYLGVRRFVSGPVPAADDTSVVVH
jgi:basic amino acid/polyamine antiporter, APA family